MIKGIVLDVDGIIVGEKIGFNSPYPHPDVLKKLKEIRTKGTPIVLCTAKPYYAITEIIKRAYLDNPHITDAGAVIIDPIDHVLIKKHVIKKEIAQKILELCITNNIYVEFYTIDNYFIQQSQVSEITQKHTHVLQHEAKIALSLLNESLNQEITKIMPIAQNEEEKIRVDDLLGQYKQRLSVSWGVHPVALPLQFGIITALDSSKKKGTETIVKNLNLIFQEVLGIGDSKSDWSFMQQCGYAATLENGSNELKELIKTKGQGKYFIGKSVDENGVLDVFNYFSSFLHFEKFK